MPKPPLALFFDVNETLLDLAPLKESVNRALGGRQELVPLWFTSLLHYSLVTTVGGGFTPFDEIASACLQMLAFKHEIALSEKDARHALKPMRSLPAHTEVPEALGQLQKAGFRMFALTNSATDALADQMANSGLGSYFEGLMSVEAFGRYKPHRKVYRKAAKKAGVALSDCMLIAAHGWDIAGAAWAGMQTAFLEREQQSLYPLADLPNLHEANLQELSNRLVQWKTESGG